MSATTATSGRLSRAWMARLQRYSLVVMLLLVVILFAGISKPFFTISNLDNVLLQAAATAIAAVGMTFVIILAEIDISIGSLMSLAITVAWMAGVAHGAVAGVAATVDAWIYPVGLAMGVLLGLVNGLLINLLGINALIATLATMFAFRGIALKLVGAGDMTFLQSAVMFLGRTELFGVGLPVYVMLVVAAVAALVLRRTPVGRYLYAIGGSQRSARETGLPVKRMRLVAYGVSGFCAALAGLIITSQVGTLQASLGEGFEFTVITAVVVGGTSLLGGRGTIIGSILGAILLVVIDNGLNLINASVYIYDVVKGVILILAVMIDVLLLRRLRE